MFSSGQIWHSEPQRQVHTSETSLIFDSTQITRAKAYFQCLLDMPRTMSLTSSLPSDELVLYFKIILQGKAVEPGQSNRALQLQFSNAKNRSLDSLKIMDEIVLEELEDNRSASVAFTFAAIETVFKWFSNFDYMFVGRTDGRMHGRSDGLMDGRSVERSGGRAGFGGSQVFQWHQIIISYQNLHKHY